MSITNLIKYPVYWLIDQWKGHQYFASDPPIFEVFDDEKIVKFLVYDKSSNASIIEYLTNISDLHFTAYESDSLYNNACYYYGEGLHTSAIIVVATHVTNLYRRLRVPGWKYVSIKCHQNDTRFDKFPDYKIIPLRYTTLLKQLC